MNLFNLLLKTVQGKYMNQYQENEYVGTKNDEENEYQERCWVARHLKKNGWKYILPKGSEIISE